MSTAPTQPALDLHTVGLSPVKHRLGGAHGTIPHPDELWTLVGSDKMHSLSLPVYHLYTVSPPGPNG